MPRVVLQQRAAVLDGILAGGMRQFVDEALHHEAVDAVPHRAPPQHGNAGPGRMQVDTVRRRAQHIRRVRHAFGRGGVDAVLDHHGFHERAGHDRLAHHHLVPRRRQAVFAQADLDLLDERRAVVAAARIVLARPYRLDRRLRGPGHVHGFRHDVRVRRGASTETAAEERRVDADLLRRHAEDLRGAVLVQRGELRAAPDVAPVVADLDGAVQRFHRRVREVGNGIFGLDGLGGLAEAGHDIARAYGGRAVLGRQLRELLAQRGAVELGAFAGLPHHLQRIAAQLGGPEVLGDHGHAAGHLHHVAHAGHGTRRGGVERLHLAAEHR